MLSRTKRYSDKGTYLDIRIGGHMHTFRQRDRGHLHRFCDRYTCTNESLVTWGTHAQNQTKDKRDTCTDSDKGTGGHMHKFGHKDIIRTKGHFVLWHSEGPSSQTRGYLDMQRVPKPSSDHA